MMKEKKSMNKKKTAEMIIKGRLRNLPKLIQEFGQNLQLNLVPSLKNKVDILTKVKKSWL